MRPDAVVDGAAAAAAGPGAARSTGARSDGGRATTAPTADDMHTAAAKPLLVRGGAGGKGWFGGSGDYDEFPSDFDYEPTEDEDGDDDDDDGSMEDNGAEFGWQEDDEQPGGIAAPAPAAVAPPGRALDKIESRRRPDLKDSSPLEEQDVLMKEEEEEEEEQGRSGRPDRRMLPAAGFGQGGRAAEGRPPAGAWTARKRCVGGAVT